MNGRPSRGVGSPAGRGGGHDGEATGRVGALTSVEEYEARRRADQLRRDLALGDGEAALVAMHGAAVDFVVRLGDGVASLGRSTSATVVLDDVTVSRRHAEVRRSAAAYRLVDAGSLNGTYLNGRLAADAPLAHGDEVRVGRFRLCFVAGAP